MPDSHDEFDYLCALEAAGQISTEERGRLHGHLKTCSACRQSLDEYEHCAEALSERSEMYATVPVPKGMYSRFRARALDHGIQLPADTPEEASAVPRWVTRFRWISVTPARFAVALFLLFVLLAIPFVLRRNELHKKEQALRSAEADNQARIAALERDNDAAQITDLKNRIATLERELSRQRRMSAELDEMHTLMNNPDLHVALLRGVKRGEGLPPLAHAFYIPGRKLVLFAYDLDDPKALTRHSFYVWGDRAGTDEPVEALGRLTLEDHKNNRWAIRIESADVFSRINHIFITVESSNATITKPSGQAILVLSLGTSNP